MSLSYAFVKIILCFKFNTLHKASDVLLNNTVLYITVIEMELDDGSRKSSRRCNWIVCVTIRFAYGACEKDISLAEGMTMY